MTTAQIDIKAEIKKRIAALNVKIRELRAIESERDELEAALQAMEARSKPLTCSCEYGSGCPICRGGPEYR